VGRVTVKFRLPDQPWRAICRLAGSTTMRFGHSGYVSLHRIDQRFGPSDAIDLQEFQNVWCVLIERLPELRIAVPRPV
jgi:hypothetical protein